jgi:hypothetical protein
MNIKKLLLVLFALVFISLVAFLFLKESIMIKYYESKGIYFSKSIDVIPGYYHLPDRYLKEVQEEKLRSICNLKSIADENFNFENKRVSKVLIKIINEKDTAVGFYQLNGNYYELVGGEKNFIGVVFVNIIRDKNNTFKGIEVFDKNLKRNIKYNLVKDKKNKDELFIQ